MTLLPFSPTFFRKMDVFQQLMEYEDQKDKKHLWEGEKAVLIWAGSDQHQHLGSAINSNHVKDALAYCVKERFISQDEKTRLENSVSHILRSLEVHEFGMAESIPASKIDLVINRNGVLAGQILLETNNLRKPKKYKNWSNDWWFIYYTAGLLLFLQFVKVVVEIIKEII